MARPTKAGLDYFPFDTVSDTKMELMEAEFGLSAFAVLIKLLQKIYREKGYYCEWSDEVCLLLSKQMGEHTETLNRIVHAAVKRGIFDQTMFEAHSVLTSEDIQLRYKAATLRRQNSHIKEEFCLIEPEPEKTDGKNDVTAYTNGVKDSTNPQIKEKERKEKERKVYKKSDSRFGESQSDQSALMQQIAEFERRCFENVIRPDVQTGEAMPQKTGGAL